MFRHPNAHSNVSRALPGQADFTHIHRHSHIPIEVLIQFSSSSSSIHSCTTFDMLQFLLSVTHTLSLTHTHTQTRRQALQIANNYFLKCCKRPAYLWHIDLPSCHMPDNVHPQSYACKQSSPPPLLHVTTTVVIDRAAIKEKEIPNEIT